MNQKVRMLHTSDVHIGYAKGPNCSQTDTCQCAVIGLTAAVKRENADILLIAGDLFDHARLPDTAITRTLEILAEAGVPVAVIPGNHDVHDMPSLWTRCADEVKKTGIFLLDCLEGASVRFGSLGLTLWGRAMAEHEPGYRPLFEVPSRPVSDWYVVAAHGHLNLTSEDAHRSSPITYEEISATNADYVALGHWHVPTDASHEGVTAWYPGAPMGSPGNGTAALVVFDSDVSVHHVPVPSPVNGCV